MILQVNAAEQPKTFLVTAVSADVNGHPKRILAFQPSIFRCELLSYQEGTPHKSRNGDLGVSDPGSGRKKNWGEWCLGVVIKVFK